MEKNLIKNKINKKRKILYIIIPVYNEKEVIHELINRLKKFLLRMNKIIPLEIIILNDGLIDNTYLFLKDSSLKNNNLKIISFPRNFGHRITIMTGFDYASGDYVATIDADLQVPPELTKVFPIRLDWSIFIRYCYFCSQTKIEKVIYYDS